MKSQDILVILKVLSLKEEQWTQAVVADSLLISPAEVSSVFERLIESGFINQTKDRVNKQALREFLIHGLKYVFPAKLGPKVRGIATAHSAPPIRDLITEGEDIFVWKTASGNRRGLSVEPLYKTVPKIVSANKALYELLVIVDTLRIGRVREIEVAISELDKRLEYVG